MRRDSAPAQKKNFQGLTPSFFASFNNFLNDFYARGANLCLMKRVRDAPTTTKILLIAIVLILLPSALQLYLQAFKEARSAGERAILLSRIGRCRFKLGS